MAQRDPISDDPAVAGTLGALALSVVRPGATTLALRALRWHRDLERLGLRVAFTLVHDVGLLLAGAAEQLAIGPRAPVASLGQVLGSQELAGTYLELIRELSGCEAARRAQSLRLSDDMIVVVLSKLLAPISDRLTAAPPYASRMVADASLFEQAEPRLAQLFGMMDRTFEWQSLSAICSSRLRVLTVADALDIDTLRLLGVLGEGAGASVQVDLLAAMSSPSANDVVNFSLEILPSVLESKQRPGLTTRAGEGLGGIGTRGNLDALVLSELAWDNDDFVRRVLDNEVLYYSKETVAEPAGRRHVLLVDASASMRGQREVFARGMALATAKKLLIGGEEATIRFFDARLYEPHMVRAGQVPTAQVLSFVGERGRNPARVFSELVTTLDIERSRDPRDVVLHVFTHAALYIPRPVVQAIKQRARIGVIFILPSGGGPLQLDYLDLLDAKWVIDHDTLAQREARARKARDILGEIDAREPRASSPE